MVGRVGLTYPQSLEASSSVTTCTRSPTVYCDAGYCVVFSIKNMHWYNPRLFFYVTTLLFTLYNMFASLGVCRPQSTLVGTRGTILPNPVT